MEDLKTRIREFFREIEYTDLKKDWVNRVAELGINEREAQKWAAEIGHVVDEFESRLSRLANVLEETDPERIPVKIYSWSVGVTEVTVPEIVGPAEQLQMLLQKYIPPEPDYDDDE